MSHQYLTRTVHLPVTADGRLIKNSFGVVIATVASADPSVAAALAQIINLGQPAAEAHDAAYDAKEDRMAAAFRASRRGAS